MKDFMRRTGISIKGITLERGNELEKRVREVVAKWDLGDVFLEKYDPVLVNATRAVGCGYSHTPFDVQVHITLFTFMATCIDDLAVPRVALEEFMQRFYSGSPQLHPLLDRLIENILGMRAHFPAFPAKLIIQSTIDFVNMMAFEQETETAARHYESLSFVTMKRWHNGAGNAYYCFIFDKYNFPDVTSYIQGLP